MATDRRAVSGKLATEYLSKFPSTSKTELARMLLRDHPRVFNSLDHARQMIRNYTGGKGALARQRYRNRIMPSKAVNPNIPVPSPIPEQFKWVDLPAGRWLVMGDVHIPFHDPRPIQAAVEAARKENVTGVILNGDICDNHRLSRFSKDPRLRDFGVEVEKTNEFLSYLRSKFPKGDILWKEGNHEVRYFHYLQSHAAELLNAPGFDYEERFDLDNIGVRYMRRNEMLRAGELIIIHGDEMFGGVGGVNPARLAFMKTLSCVLTSHFHRASEHTEPTLDGRTLVSFSLGCMCSIHPDYALINKWGWGFGILDTDGKNFDFRNKNIVGSKVYSS